MISISARVFDPAGSLLIRNHDPDLESAERRVTRTATLDGSVTVTDTGQSDGDRTINVVALRATAAMVETARRFVQLYPLVTVALADGCFIAVPRDYSTRRDALNISLLITERVSE